MGSPSDDGGLVVIMLDATGEDAGVVIVTPDDPRQLHGTALPRTWLLDLTRIPRFLADGPLRPDL